MQNRSKTNPEQNNFFCFGFVSTLRTCETKKCRNKTEAGVACLSIRVLTSLSNTAVSSTLRNMQTAFLTATHHIYDSRLFLILDTWFNPCLSEHIGPHSHSTLVCWGMLPPPLPRWVPFFEYLSWWLLSSLSLAGLVPSWTLEPPSIVLAVVFADDTSVSDDRASAVFFHW